MILVNGKWRRNPHLVRSPGSTAHLNETKNFSTNGSRFEMCMLDTLKVDRNVSREEERRALAGWLHIGNGFIGPRDTKLLVLVKAEKSFSGQVGHLAGRVFIGEILFVNASISLLLFPRQLSQWRSSTTSSSPTTISTRTGSAASACTSTRPAASLDAGLLVCPRPLPSPLAQ